MRRHTRFGRHAELYRRKKLSGAQKHIAQDCKDDHDPSFARNFSAGREHGGMQNFGTENFGPESFGVKFFDAKSSNDPQSPSTALNSVAKSSGEERNFTAQSFSGARNFMAQGRGSAQSSTAVQF